MASRQPSVLILACLFIWITFIDGLPKQFTKEEVVINATAVSETSQATYNVQIILNVTLVDNQTVINGIPMDMSEARRLTVKALLLDFSNNNTEHVPIGMTVTAVAQVTADVSHLQSEAGEDRVLLTLREELVQLQEEQVQQPNVCQLEILLSKDYEEIRVVTHSSRLAGTKRASVSGETDLTMTWMPNLPNGDADLSGTTSDTPLHSMQTPQEEVAEPGKLPETPLRMEPGLLSGSTEEEQDAIFNYTLPEVPLHRPAESYNAVCAWLERFRQRVQGFWEESLPVMFQVMRVVVVGVAGAAVVLKILDVLFPSSEHKGLLPLTRETLHPEAEYTCLLEAVEEEEEEKEEKKQSEGGVEGKPGGQGQIVPPSVPETVAGHCPG